MSSNMTLQRLVNTTNILFHLMGLQPYAMVLPMDKDTAAKSKKKIVAKIMSNRITWDSEKDEITDVNSKSGEKRNVGSGLPADDSESPFFAVSRFIQRLDNENMRGCMILLAKKQNSRFGVVPLAGGIIEIFDEHERCIQAVWANSNLDSTLNQKSLLASLILRLCAHAYQLSLPDSKRVQQKSRLVSIYHSMGQTFPTDAFNFLRNEMQLSKHYDSLSYTGKHNDNSKVPCKCTKMSCALDAQLFYGISESRFNTLYQGIYEQILLRSIGATTPVVGVYSLHPNFDRKYDRVSKAVAEIERSLKEDLPKDEAAGKKRKTLNNTKRMTSPV